MTADSAPKCKALVYPGRGGIGEARPCLNDAARDGYCFAHHPKTIEARDEKYTKDALRRKRKRELHTRKLLLIPLLDEARKKQKSLRTRSAKLGAQVVINLLEFAIREEN